MSKTIRLTAAQALVRFMTRQMTVIDGETLPVFAGMWAIFGHGNVAGLGPALAAARASLPTFRAHNEQAMAHAAIAYSKASFRRRMMAATTSRAATWSRFQSSSGRLLASTSSLASRSLVRSVREDDH